MDSTAETLHHIAQVAEVLELFIAAIRRRQVEHDRSKLEPPEKAIFDRYPLAQRPAYGSPAYDARALELQLALEHHYLWNRHHPQHFEDGVAGMTLIDVLEMLADWLASSKDPLASLEVGRARFALEPQMYSVLRNTVLEMLADWLELADATSAAA